MDDLSLPRISRFDDFLLDRHTRSVTRIDGAGNETPVPMGSRAFDLLCLLMEQSGVLLSKSDIMQVVWGNVLVEDANLTMQISALRRTLDAGRRDGSCIQTVPGRGYRFLPRVVPWPPDPPPLSDAPILPAAEPAGVAEPPDVAEPADVPDLAGVTEPAGASTPAEVRPAPRRVGRIWAVAVLLGAVALAVGFHAWFRPAAIPFADRPRLSVVVLPFENLDGDPRDDRMAETVADDLTTHLSRISGMFVIARTAAETYKGSAASPREVGDALGVRYVVEGSVRKAGDAPRINVQLIETDTDAQLWADRFDLPAPGLANGRGGLDRQIGQAVNIALTDAASARGKREHPDDPDAIDLILQARSLSYHTPDMRGLEQRRQLFQRAVALDPYSIDALLGLAFALIESEHRGPDLDQAADLIDRARRISPNEQDVLAARARLLTVEGECGEAVVAFQYFREQFPRAAPWRSAPLGMCLTVMGRAEEAISMVQENIRADPHAPYMSARYGMLGFATLMLGRDAAAIGWYQRALAANPDNRPAWRAEYTLRAAAANARLGHIEEAHRLVSEANQIWPWYTVRGHAEGGLANPIFAAQMERYRDALRLAGLRDHADEDADFGAKSDDRLHEDDLLAGPTPTTVPGAATIRTQDLARLLTDRAPIIVDTMEAFSGRSLPGAFGLKDSGWGTGTADSMQDRLRRKMSELTGGDRTRAIVVVGWNPEHFGGRNLALRLAALGYTRIHWYRGGREAWEVAGLPEAPMVPAVW
jgi:TolB-like protein/DNA-binding winged helix-turn-helix (wHTH) protein/tetratricopeptide (TPR) repeat protein